MQQANSSGADSHGNELMGPSRTLKSARDVNTACQRV